MYYLYRIFIAFVKKKKQIGNALYIYTFQLVAEIRTTMLCTINSLGVYTIKKLTCPNIYLISNDLITNKRRTDLRLLFLSSFKHYVEDHLIVYKTNCVCVFYSLTYYMYLFCFFSVTNKNYCYITTVQSQQYNSVDLKT